MVPAPRYGAGAPPGTYALAELGRRDRATALLEMLLPIHHTRTPEAIDVYRVEPYVVVADVYGVAPHLGRGGWTWYTGSAGWMYRVALESILGVTLEGGTTLRVKPCIPDAWPGFDSRCASGWARGTRYEVEVVNRGGVVTSVSVDAEQGVVQDGVARIPLRDDGGTHRVGITLATTC